MNPKGSKIGSRGSSPELVEGRHPRYSQKRAPTPEGSQNQEFWVYEIPSRAAHGFRILLAILVAASFAGCKAGPHAGSVWFFFTAQTHGRLTPCGCFTGQYGGLSRLKTAIGMELPADAIGLDVGDALEGTEDYQLMKYKEVVKAYSGMNYAALNVGHTEASLSAAQLQKLAADSPIPMISANLIDRATGKPLLPGWIIINRAGRRIAIVGVVDPKGLEDTLGDGLEVEDMETCLGRILPEVKQSADMLVLMAFTNEAELDQLAKDFYEFRVILGGNVSQPAQSLISENQSLIYYTANESKSFGILQLMFGADGSIKPGDHEIVLLHDGFPEDQGVVALANDYRNEIRKTSLSIDDPAHLWANQVPGAHAAATYVGSESCLGCHSSSAIAWTHSAHAQAFEALKQKNADADPSCIGCHTVGFGSPGGYRREYAGAKLTDVGCESCHGPGSIHVTQRQSGGPITFFFRPLAAGDCMKCHDGEFSPPFDWNQMWPKIQHGKETHL